MIIGRPRSLPSAPMRQRLLWLGGALVGLSLLTGALVLFSAWSEQRFPSDEVNASLLTRVRGTLTKPIVRAVGRQIQRRMRSRVEARRLMSGLTDEEAIALFLDERTSLSERRVYAYRLAATGSPQGIAALRAVLETAPPEDRAFIVQLIGSTGNHAVKKHLWPFLDDTDERVARAAIRGLCTIGGSDVATRLARILADAQGPEALRVEAALGLGQMGTAAARAALVDALTRDPQAPAATQVLDSLGRFRFAQVSATFEEILSRPDTPSDFRVAAVEALGHSSEDAVPFLLAVASGDASADVRAAAAWASGVNAGGKRIGPRLAELAEREPEADVRRRLYEALLPQTEIPIERLLPTIGSEHDVAARVAGFNAVGGAVGRDRSTPVAALFDADIVPELERIATSENSLNVRMRAVFALRRAGTPAAQDALTTIATTARPPVAVAARHGLRVRD